MPDLLKPLAWALYPNMQRACLLINLWWRRGEF